MLRLLFLASILLFTMVQAESVIKIQSECCDLEKFKLNYFIDHSANMTISEIKDQKFTEGANKISLGIDAPVVWVKLVLKNESPELIDLNIHNIYAFHASSLHYYELNAKEDVVRQINYEPRNNINTESNGWSNRTIQSNFGTQ